MVSSSQKRHAAQGVVAAGLCSQRQACRYLGLARSSWAYTRRPPTPRAVQLRDGVAALAVRHPRYGYRRAHDMLRRQGLHCSLRTVQRLREVPSIQAAYQLHKNAATTDGENTTPGLIANVSPSGGQWIRVSVAMDSASYTVQIGPGGEKATFPTR